jgi:cytochrome c oxidase subunit 4
MEHRAGPSTKTYFVVWCALLAFTLLTVTVSGLNLGNLSTLSAIAIAATKSGLILAFFMHLRYENRIFVIIFFVAIITLATIIGFTFFDTSFR